MEKLLKEIETIKTQQFAFNNLMIENTKQSEIIHVVLRELLMELKAEKKEDELQKVMENIMLKLDVLIGKLDGPEMNKI